MASFFVSSSGTGHVINASSRSSLVPQLPLYVQFYISRTFQNPHQLQQRVQAAFLPPPRVTGVCNQYLPLCSPELPARGLARAEKPLPPHLASQPSSYPESRPEEAARGSGGGWGEGQRTSAHRVLHLPNTTPLCHRNEIFGILYFLKKTRFLLWSHFLDQKCFLGFSFQPEELTMDLQGPIGAGIQANGWRKGRLQRAIIVPG